MTPKWKELKEVITEELVNTENPDRLSGLNFALFNMDRIEQRTLPERIVALLEGLDHEKYWNERETKSNYSSEALSEVIIKTLKSGNTSELERWQKK